MNNNQSSLPKWNRLIAFIILAVTPLIISLTTYDSFILPKIFWLSFWASLWMVVIVWQPIRWKLFASPLTKPLMALFAVSLLSVLLNYRSPIQLHGLMNLAVFIALYFAFQRFWSMRPSPHRVAQALMAAACLIAIYGLLQDYGFDFANATGGVRDWRSKVISTLGNPNFLAGWIAICLPVVIGYGLRKKTRFFGFLYSGFTVMLIAACHTVTFSVGAATGLIAALITSISGSVFLLHRIRIPIIRSVILAIIATSAFGWYMLENPYNSHGRSLYREAWESSHWWSGMGARRFIWQTTRLMIEEKPVTGIGFSNYLTVHEHYQGMNYKRQWHAHDRDYVVPVDQPHFQLLETAAEIGPLGVLALLWIALAWLKAAGRTLRRSPDPWFAWGAYAGVWVAVMHSFSSFPFHLPANALLVVVLGSYITSSPKPDSAEPVIAPLWSKIACVALALIICISSGMQYFGSQYMRWGYESNGLSAIDYLSKSRSLNPHSHQTHFLLGLHYKNQGWYGNALESFKRALQYQEDIQSHKQMAEIYLLQNNIPSAIAEFERIIEINPVFPGHYRDLITALGDKATPERFKELTTLAEQLEAQLETSG
jgi:O-antigen ligase